MRKFLASVLVVGGALLLCAPAKTAESRPLSVATDLSSQDTRPARARTRITVRPVGRLVRECSFRLVREVRASGAYVVPDERCWWARR